MLRNTGSRSGGSLACAMTPAEAKAMAAATNGNLKPVPLSNRRDTRAYNDGDG